MVEQSFLSLTNLKLESSSSVWLKIGKIESPKSVNYSGNRKRIDDFVDEIGKSINRHDTTRVFITRSDFDTIVRFMKRSITFGVLCVRVRRRAYMYAARPIKI